ncbi:putative serine/threonine-protein kinase WNK4 [Wolffia australiana]
MMDGALFWCRYRAFDETEGREVAWNQVLIEDVLRSPEDLERLYSEVHLLKSLRHENIVQYLNSWVDGQRKTINLITELFTSGSLRQYRKRYPNVEVGALKSWARQILHGLQYLHDHNPPILHRDLKCDNLLVNGNKGEVKIGDLGLAIIMQCPSAKSIIGTPEFMAPELYEEAYDHLVDVYSFGMCMLEMVTLEYPYSECRNAAQIYKRVISGVKPLALKKVADPQVKQLIEKCLLPASKRCSVKELLHDAFFQPTISRPPQDHGRGSQEERHGIEAGNINSGETDFDDPLLISMEFQKTKDQIHFNLRGEKIDRNTVSFVLRIMNVTGDGRNIHFTFFLDSDTAMLVVREMVEHLGLPSCHDGFIAQFIDFSVAKFVPGWSPSNELSSDSAQSSMVHQWSGPPSMAGSEVDPDYCLIFANLSIRDGGRSMSESHGGRLT